ncbi:MAG: histidinol-phosphate transaminase [Candidatus Sumerlaeaceae bacterium]|nr:histidinol-phosphate transaminase [Candidatus Sumerlaeaceae bacterium]
MRFNSILASLEAYVPGEQPRDGNYVKLNTNESPYPPAPEVVDAIKDCACQDSLNKYPDPLSLALRKAIAERFGFSPENVLVGNGSDEVLRLVCHALLERGDCISMLYPTYVLYRTLAAMFGAGCVEIDVEPPSFDIPKTAFTQRSQILFLANPNPPIGTLYPVEMIEELAKCQRERLVVVDEAYVDFSNTTCIELVRRYPNVAVTRTFSKCFALAGLRVGFIVGDRLLIEQLEKLKDSYNVNRISQAAALAAWQATDYYSGIAKRICATRDYLTTELRRRGFDVAQSAGNFLFARCSNAEQLYLRLKERKILVRYFKMRRLEDGLRITIGTPDDVSILLAALDELQKEP